MSGTAEDFIKMVKNKEDTSNFLINAERDWFYIIDNHPDCKVNIAQNKNVCPYILEILSRDCISKVRFAVAQREECNKETFEILKDDPSEEVRNAVLNNKKYQLRLNNKI